MPSQQADYATQAYHPPISRFVRRASRTPNIPARRAIPHRAITARKAIRASPSAIRTMPMRAFLSRDRGMRASPSRASTRILPIRISAIRISPRRILPMPASRSRRASTQASPTRAFPALMASLSRSRPRTTVMALRPIKASIPSTASRRRITARCRKAIRGGNCKPSTPSTINRRRFRWARPSRPAGPRRISTRASGSMPISSTKVRRFPRQAPAPSQG